MKMTRKQTVGENLLYVMVWAAIILVPVLNSQMMSERAHRMAADSPLLHHLHHP